VRKWFVFVHVEIELLVLLLLLVECSFCISSNFCLQMSSSFWNFILENARNFSYLERKFSLLYQQTSSNNMLEGFISFRSLQMIDYSKQISRKLLLVSAEMPGNIRNNSRLKYTRQLRD